MLYLVCLIAGGIFVVLSMLGGIGADLDVDFDSDFDGDLEVGGGGISAIASFLSFRFFTLFATFFGMTGFLLGKVGYAEPLVLIISLILGFTIGLVGNIVIKKFAQKTISSGLSDSDFIGKTAKVIVPFSGSERGKIKLEAKGQEALLIANSADTDQAEFEVGDEVVVVEINGSTAKVIKPN